MNYHNILHDDMRNGDGLRVVLFVSGCDHKCKNCQNQQTWAADSGILFDEAAKQEIFEQLSKDYIAGITFSGGDPLNDANVFDVYKLCQEIKETFPTKTVWIYTGYTLEEIFPKVVTSDLNPEREYRTNTALLADVLVDGRFIEEYADINYEWAGSTNQRVIDMPKTIEIKKIVLHS